MSISVSGRYAALLLISSVFLGAGQVASTGNAPGTQAVPIGMEPVIGLQRATDVGPANPEEVLSLTVSMPFARPGELQAFVDSVSDPRSRAYRNFITPEEVGARFGLDAGEVERVADYLRGHGFSITMVSKNRTTILANATVAQAERAFHTTIRRYTLVPQDDVEPSTFVANATPPELPREIASLVADVSGLETYTRPQRRTTLTPSLTRGLYDSDDLFANGVQGTGRTVGVSNWDGFRSADYVNYVNHFGLPHNGAAGSNVQVIPCQGGGAGAGPAGAEGDLDIQMELGMVPLGTVQVYDGTLTGNLTGVLAQEVNSNSADVISESYGWNIGSTTANAAHNSHLSMSAQGITYCAATGDSGTTLEPYSYPNSEPEVLQVGGTVANVQSPSGARISEVGWSGSGGGWSTKTLAFNVRPSWQHGNGVPATPDRRLNPDVGFHSSGGGGGAYQFYTGGSLTSGYVGTSFASPIVAGLIAIAEERLIDNGALPPDGSGHRRLGRVADLVYSMNGRSDVWFDIVSGANGTLPDGSSSTAHAGWDYVAGWGPFDTQVFADVTTCIEGFCGPGTAYCAGDSADPNVSTFCPCLNFGATGHGCENSANAAGALLSAAGSTNPDSVVFTSSGEPGSALSILMQGSSNASAGVVAGDGVRCVAGTLKRLYSYNASSGSVVFPQGGDPGIRTQSAILGDSIPPGGTRYYQVYYRDANTGFCTPDTFNLSSGYFIVWP
jgi:subtilase family serine protease